MQGLEHKEQNTRGVPWQSKRNPTILTACLVPLAQGNLSAISQVCHEILEGNIHPNPIRVLIFQYVQFNLNLDQD